MVNQVSFCGKVIVPNDLYLKIKTRLPKKNIIIIGKAIATTNNGNKCQNLEEKQFLLTGSDAFKFTRFSQKLFKNTPDKNTMTKLQKILIHETAKGVPVAKTVDEALKALELDVTV